MNNRTSQKASRQVAEAAMIAFGKDTHSWEDLQVLAIGARIAGIGFSVPRFAVAGLKATVVWRNGNNRKRRHPAWQWDNW